MLGRFDRDELMETQFIMKTFGSEKIGGLIEDVMRSTEWDKWFCAMGGWYLVDVLLEKQVVESENEVACSPSSLGWRVVTARAVGPGNYKETPVFNGAHPDDK